MSDEEFHHLVSPDEGVRRQARETEDLTGYSPVQVFATWEAMAFGERLRRCVVMLDEFEDVPRWARVPGAPKRAVARDDGTGAHVPACDDGVALWGRHVG